MNTLTCTLVGQQNTLIIFIISLNNCTLALHCYACCQHLFLYTYESLEKNFLPRGHVGS